MSRGSDELPGNRCSTGLPRSGWRFSSKVAGLSTWPEGSVMRTIPAPCPAAQPERGISRSTPELTMRRRRLKYCSLLGRFASFGPTSSTGPIEAVRTVIRTSLSSQEYLLASTHSDAETGVNRPVPCRPTPVLPAGCRSAGRAGSRLSHDGNSRTVRRMRQCSTIARPPASLRGPWRPAMRHRPPIPIPRRPRRRSAHRRTEMPQPRCPPASRPPVPRPAPNRPKRTRDRVRRVLIRERVPGAVWPSFSVVLWLGGWGRVR